MGIVRVKTHRRGYRIVRAYARKSEMIKERRIAIAIGKGELGTLKGRKFTGKRRENLYKAGQINKAILTQKIKRGFISPRRKQRGGFYLVTWPMGR